MEFTVKPSTKLVAAASVLSSAVGSPGVVRIRYVLKTGFDRPGLAGSRKMLNVLVFFDQYP